MPHSTTRYGPGGGPWLVSMAMWSNCMRFVGDEWMPIRELERRSGTRTNLDGMRRWGYIRVHEKSLRATIPGHKAREVWRPLTGEIEGRWRQRFGTQQIGRLEETLRAVDHRLESGLPDCLPILGYGLFSQVPDGEGRPAADIDFSLPAMLARVLLQFAIEFEREFQVSLAICADVIRVLNEDGVRMQDLPALSGVSKEAIQMALGFLGKRGMVAMGTEPGGRRKIARLTSEGRVVQEGYRRVLGALEERWRARFGEDIVALRQVLAGFNGDLFGGLEPYTDGWRASVPKPATLPHYPMVLHRGGYPDGS